MTRITQISAAALLAVFASTAFVSAGNAAPKLKNCEVLSKSSDYLRGDCSRYNRKFKRTRTRVQPTNNNRQPIQNFRSASPAEYKLIIQKDGPSGGRGGSGKS